MSEEITSWEEQYPERAALLRLRKTAIGVARGDDLGAALQLADDTDAEVRRAVAERTDLPNELLSDLAMDQAWEVRLGVASNPSCPTGALDTLCVDGVPGILKACLAHPTLSDEQRAGIELRLASLPRPSWPSTAMKDWDAELADLSEGELRRYVGQVEPEARMAAARHPRADLDILTQLASDEDSRVRWVVARRPSTPPNLLDQLSRDDALSVLHEVARHKRTPSPVLVRLAQSEHAHAFVDAIAAHENASPSLLEALVREYDHDSVRRPAWSNPNFPAELRAAVPMDLPADLIAALGSANARLSRQLPVPGLAEAIRRAAVEDSVLIAQAAVNYAWADCKLAIAMAVRMDDDVVVRIKRRRYHRDGVARPASWPEMRGFPRGDVEKKLRRWAAADDVFRVPVAMAEGASEYLGPSFWLRDYEIPTRRETWLQPGQPGPTTTSPVVMTLHAYNPSGLLCFDLANDRDKRQVEQLRAGWTSAVVDPSDYEAAERCGWDV